MRPHFSSHAGDHGIEIPTHFPDKIPFNGRILLLRYMNLNDKDYCVNVMNNEGQVFVSNE